MPATLTPEQAREALDRKGMSIAEFCRTHSLNKNLVSDLLNGRKKGRRGRHIAPPCYSVSKTA